MKVISPEHRVMIGTIMMGYAMIMESIDFFMPGRTLNQSVMIAIITAATGLLSAGIIKQHKAFRDV